MEFLANAINNANNKKSKLPKEILEIDGMTSFKIKHFLNNICDFEGCNFLEVGSYMGSTFMSAIYNNSLKATSIDFWSNKKDFQNTRLTFKRNLKKTLKLQTKEVKQEIQIINKDCFYYDKKELKDVNVYFYDGPHDRESQIKALTQYNDILANQFILIIDDWNSFDTKVGTFVAINRLRYNVIGHCELMGLPENWKMDDDFYWNGLFIAFLAKK